MFGSLWPGSPQHSSAMRRGVIALWGMCVFAGLWVASTFTTVAARFFTVVVGTFLIGVLVLFGYVRVFDARTGSWVSFVALLCFVGSSATVFTDRPDQLRFELSRRSFEELAERPGEWESQQSFVGLVQVTRCYKYPEFERPQQMRTVCNLPRFMGDFETSASLVRFERPPNNYDLEVGFGYDSTMESLGGHWYFIQDSQF
jgi:uncharacterized membrane protein